MSYKVRLDSNKLKEFDLFSFNTTSFVDNPVLKIQSNDLAALEEAFTGLKTIEIFQNDVCVHSSSQYDGFSQIAYEGKVFVKEIGKFTPCLAVTLTKMDLAGTVARLDEQLNPTYDFDSMSINEVVEYQSKIINADCEAEISKGITVETAYGEEFFGLPDYSQRNIKNLFDIIKDDVGGLIPGLPYHSKDNECRFYSREDIIKIYTGMEAKVTCNTTHANLLKIYISSLTDKTEILSINFAEENPSEEYREKEKMLIEQSMVIINGILATYLPQKTETSTGEEQPSDEDAKLDNPSTDENAGNVDDVSNSTTSNGEEPDDNTYIPSTGEENNSTDNSDASDNSITDDITDPVVDNIEPTETGSIQSSDVMEVGADATVEEVAEPGA